MIFLVVLCEGQTEMGFVKEVLAEHLGQTLMKVHPILLGKKLKHDAADAPGGVLKWGPVHKHVMAALRQYSSPTSFVTTMIDFYAFLRDFPDYDTLVSVPGPRARIAKLEEEMFNRCGRDARFVPHLQLHEFEALLFTRLDELRAEFDAPVTLDGIARLEQDVSELAPEEINQTVEGAPSRRLDRFLHSAYRKRDMGPRITKRIGVADIRHSCPHFSEWVKKLENLS